MHRFDDLPTGTQLQTKVGAARKLPPLNGETETNNKKGCENSQPEFLQKTIRQTITLLRAKRTATVLQAPVFVVEANAEKQAKSVIAKTCDEWETIRQHRQIVQLLPQKVDTVVKNLFFARNETGADVACLLLCKRITFQRGVLFVVEPGIVLPLTAVGAVHLFHCQVPLGAT